MTHEEERDELLRQLLVSETANVSLQSQIQSLIRQRRALLCLLGLALLAVIALLTQL